MTFYTTIRRACSTKGVLYVKTVAECIRCKEVKPPEGLTIKETLTIIKQAISDFNSSKLQRDAKKIKKANRE